MKTKEQIKIPCEIGVGDTTLNQVIAKNEKDHEFILKTQLHTIILIGLIALATCGLGLKIRRNRIAIEEIKEPVAVATVNITDDVLMTIAKMEQDIDMLKARLGEEKDR